MPQRKGLRPRQARLEPSDSNTADAVQPTGNALLLEGVYPSNCDRPAATPTDLTAGFHAALQSWVDQGVATLSAPSWARVLPVLLELRAHSPEMAEVLNNDFDAKLHLIASIL